MATRDDQQAEMSAVVADADVECGASGPCGLELRRMRRRARLTRFLGRNGRPPPFFDGGRYACSMRVLYDAVMARGLHGMLPNCLHGILRDNPVVRDNDKPFFLCLRH